MRPVQTLFLPLILLVLPTAQADTIHLTDGTSIEGVSIKEETLQGVVYKDGRTDATVQSNLIRSITFSPMPVLIDRAEAGLDEDQYMGSVAGYEEYIAQTSSPERKFPWALNYAYFRVIELQQTMGKYDAVVAAADRLIEKAGTSRYAPLALVKKAEALFDGGKAKEALVALDALTQMSKSAQLGERWDRLESKSWRPSHPAPAACISPFGAEQKLLSARPCLRTTTKQKPKKSSAVS